VPARGSLPKAWTSPARRPACRWVRPWRQPEQQAGLPSRWDRSQAATAHTVGPRVWRGSAGPPAAGLAAEEEAGAAATMVRAKGPGRRPALERRWQGLGHGRRDGSGRGLPQLPHSGGTSFNRPWACFHRFPAAFHQPCRAAQRRRAVAVVHGPAGLVVALGPIWPLARPCRAGWWAACGSWALGHAELCAAWCPRPQRVTLQPQR